MAGYRNDWLWIWIKFCDPNLENKNAMHILFELI